MASILIVEDDVHVARALREGLEDRGHSVVVAGNAAGAHRALDTLAPHVPDAIILDLLLPDADGLVLCGDLKARADVPILVCSALPPQPNAVLSQRLGADDFLSKPFSLDDVEARLTALVSRARREGAEGRLASAEERVVGDLVVSPARRLATLRGVPLPLTPTEYKLLVVLAERPGDAFAREEIGQAVWGAYDAAIGKSIDVHIAHLRAKIAAALRGAPEDGPVPVIEAVRGYGFRLSAGLREALGKV